MAKPASYHVIAYTKAHLWGEHLPPVVATSFEQAQELATDCAINRFGLAQLIRVEVARQ